MNYHSSVGTKNKPIKPLKWKLCSANSRSKKINVIILEL